MLISMVLFALLLPKRQSRRGELAASLSRVKEARYETT